MVPRVGIEPTTIATQSYSMPYYSIKQAIWSYREKVEMC